MWSSLGSDAEGFVKDWVRNIWSTLVSVCGSVSNFGNHISLHIHTWYIMIYHDVWRYKTPRFLLLTGICFFFSSQVPGFAFVCQLPKLRLATVQWWIERSGATSWTPRAGGVVILGGDNSNMFDFPPRTLGKWSNLTSIFFKWVGSTTN